jgi:hypothetical protein
VDFRVIKRTSRWNRCIMKSFCRDVGMTWGNPRVFESRSLEPMEPDQCSGERGGTCTVCSVRCELACCCEHQVSDGRRLANCWPSLDFECWCQNQLRGLLFDSRHCLYVHKNNKWILFIAAVPNRTWSGPVTRNACYYVLMDVKQTVVRT